MRSRTGTVLTFFAICLLVLPLPGLPVSAMAQESSGKADSTVKEATADETGGKSAELLKRIDVASRNAQRYAGEIKTASGEDRLVLELQLYRTQLRMLDDMHQLVDVVSKVEKTGKQLEIHQKVESMLSTAISMIWSNIDGLRNDIDALRARRPKTPAEAQPALESEILTLTSRLNRMYEMAYAHINNMKQLGMEVSNEQAKLSALLLERVEELSGRMRLAIDRIGTLEALRKEIPQDTNVPNQLVAAAKSLDTNADSMTIILGLMDSLKMDTSGYRARLVEATQDFSSGLTDTGVAVSLAGRAIERTTNWLLDSGPKFLLRLLVFFGIIVIFHYAKRMVRSALTQALSVSKVDLSELAKRMITSTISNLVMIIGLMIALSQLGISLGPLLAGLGIAGFIVGFALQDSLSNFASGVMILLYRPYDVGDLVDVGGVFGKVDKMSLVSTNITTLDNQMIMVPNNKIWGDVIKNVTAQDIRRVDMVFGIAYSDDIATAEEILDEILKSHEKVLDDPEPVVRLHTLGESSVDFVVRPWAKVSDYWEVYWDVTKAVKLRFDEAGISIPFPQRDLHLFPNAPLIDAAASS